MVKRTTINGCWNCENFVVPQPDEPQGDDEPMFCRVDGEPTKRWQKCDEWEIDN